jgi:hypothetical protein
VDRARGAQLRSIACGLDGSVISGSVIVEGRVLRAGDFHHAEGDSDHGEAWTDEDVELLLVASASDYAS